MQPSQCTDGLTDKCISHQYRIEAISRVDDTVYHVTADVALKSGLWWQ